MSTRRGASFGWRAMVGWIHSYGMLHQGPVDLYQLLPEGFGILFTTLGKMDQSDEETEAALSRLEPYAELLGRNGAEYFVVNSSPMVTYGGPGADKRIIDIVSKASGGRPGTTTTTSAVKALKALGVSRIAMCSPYVSKNAALRRFLEGEGLEVVGEHGLDEELTAIHRLPGEFSYRVGREAFKRSNGAEALYMAGGRLRVIDVIEELESDVGVPVISSTQAVVWDLLNAFGVKEPIEGQGKLLRELPAPVS